MQQIHSEISCDIPEQLAAKYHKSLNQQTDSQLSDFSALHSHLKVMDSQSFQKRILKTEKDLTFKAKSFLFLLFRS